VVQQVAVRWPSRAAGFYTREVREQGVRVGFEIVTLDGQAAMLSHVDFPGPYRVGRYGVNLENLRRVGLAALEVFCCRPGGDLVVVDEVGRMECLSPQFVETLERLWTKPVPLLITVAEKGGGYMAAIKEKSELILITVTQDNRNGLPDKILELLSLSRNRKN
ncbi:MAG: nucleoside-triphosphatase, partial [Desulfobaccales bacterium]